MKDQYGHWVCCRRHGVHRSNGFMSRLHSDSNSVAIFCLVVAQVNCLKITPDKQYLAAAGNPHVRLFEINSQNSSALVSYDGHTTNVTDVGEFDPEPTEESIALQQQLVSATPNLLKCLLLMILGVWEGYVLYRIYTARSCATPLQHCTTRTADRLLSCCVVIPGSQKVQES